METAAGALNYDEYMYSVVGQEVLPPPRYEVLGSANIPRPNTVRPSSNQSTAA